MSRAVGGGRRRCQEVWTSMSTMRPPSSADAPTHNVNAESRRRQRRFLPGYTASGEEASHRRRRRRRCCWRRSSWFGVDWFGFGSGGPKVPKQQSKAKRDREASRSSAVPHVRTVRTTCGGLRAARGERANEAHFFRDWLIYGLHSATMGSGSKNAAASAPTAATLAPPLTDPYSWFDYYDKDASNSLDQEEVVTGLLNTIQAAAANKKKTADDSSTVDAIRESIQAIWPAFDIDGNGQVSACGVGDHRVSCLYSKSYPS